MNLKQLNQMQNNPGFIAALDQSGGSTPKALKAYGIEESAYKNEDEMFDLVHQMRTRIVTSPAFTSDHILGAILFKQTMDRKVEGLYTGDYLWEEKGIIPILKVDLGLDKEEDGVQLMKPIPTLDEICDHANDRNIFGTKMRSVIKAANPAGIHKIVEQQFDFAKTIMSHGLVPIIEPEVDIHIADKKEAEDILLKEVNAQMAQLPSDAKLMFKFTIPSVDNLYADLMKDERVVRIVALSGGYSRKEANELLTRNHGLIASFSRALAQGLSAQQSDAEFNQTLTESIDSIYKASIA